MRILLLGANGQLGTDLHAACAAQERSVQLLPLRRSDLDVTQLDAVGPFLARHDFDALVNCTSYHKTDEVEDHATQAFVVNAHAVLELARACARTGAALVHISTDYVFDGALRRPYSESDGPGPINVYGASKAMGERLALGAWERTFVLRVASLFGVAGASGKGGNFVETMIRVGRERGELRVVNDITMSPTATCDVARALLALLQAEAPPGVYHLVNSGAATWYEFARAIIAGAGVPAAVEPITSREYPTRAARPPYSVLDNTKITARVGPLPHWRDALERYLVARESR
ncbi:MAG: dTDP-4-dehydrorhamnose reductase [Planctomycetota bacterium]